MFSSLRTGAASAISSMASRSIVFSLRPASFCKPLVLLDLLDDVLDALVVAGVEPLDGRHHVGLGGDRPLDLRAQEHLQAVERGRVLRLGHRDRQALVLLVLRDRHDLVGGGHALVDQLGQLGGDRDVRQLDHLHPELLAQRLQDLVFLDHAHAHRHLAEQVGAGAFLLLEHLPEGLLVQVTHVDHDRAESSRHLSVVRGQWSVVRGQLSVVSCQLSVVVVSCPMSVVRGQLSVVSCSCKQPIGPSSPCRPRQRTTDH